MRARRRAFALLAAVAVAVGAVELHYFRGGLALCHPVRKPITPADRDRAHGRLSGLEEVSFTASDGVPLRGFYVPARNGATVVLGHGLGQNRMQMLPAAEVLARHGYGALFFDWRAHGESGGDTSTWSDLEQRDFAAAVDYVSRRPDVMPGRIAGMGFSIGASTVALEAAHDPRVRAVIVEALYSSLDDEVRDQLGARGLVSILPAKLAMARSGVHFENIRPIEHVAELRPRPLLEIAGSADTAPSVSTAQRVFEAAAEPKRMWIVGGAGHGDYESVAPTEFERVVVSFLDDAFPRSD